MGTTTATAQPTLLFIPDISGFTSFVNDTEISHSQHIISELLELLVDANDIGLSVSSFEGDAILFYRTGPAPTAAELLAQVQRMYVRFHAHLKVYESYRICHCGACRVANDLTLKIVTHYGPVSVSSVKDHSTLFGREVIVAHRLLKNDVPSAEYVLITNDLQNTFANWVQAEQVAWCQPQVLRGAYDFGEIEYCHISLEPLADHVPEPEVKDFGLGAETRHIMELSAEIEAPIELVFDVVSDLSIRHLWMDGLKGSDRLNSRITRAGSTHRCVIKDKDSDPFMVSHSFESTRDRVAFTDTDHGFGLDTLYIMTRLDQNRTAFEVHYFLKRNVVKELMLKLFMRPIVRKKLVRSIANLNTYCKDLVREGRRPESQIIVEAWA